jgi:hypothetical protein
MGIKELFSKNKIKPYLTFSQKGNIWRMHFSPGDILICETRDLNAKETYFFSINYKTKQVFLSNFQLEEKWWISIESVSDDLVYFNSFKTPELPEHLGITAVDVKTGKTTWINKELTFLFADSSEVYAYKEVFEREIFYKLDSHTGNILETYEDEKITDSLLELKQFNEEKMFTGFIYPEIYIEGNDINPLTEKYLMERFKDVKFMGEIEFIDYNGLIIYNFHADSGINLNDITLPNLSNRLEIFDMRLGKMIHEEILNTDVVNYVPDSFFIRDGFLFYIKEKKELVLIELKR